jgi:hypothetical protein
MDPQDCDGAAALELSPQTACIAEDFGLSPLGEAFIGIKSDERIANDELAFWAARTMSSGRDGTAFDFQSVAPQAGLRLCNGLDRGS